MLFCFIILIIKIIIIFYIRGVDNNLFEFTCCVSIAGEILMNEKCVPYKYYVTTQPIPHEFLHGARSGGGEIVNRCLQIPRKSFKVGGMLFYQPNTAAF